MSKYQVLHAQINQELSQIDKAVQMVMIEANKANQFQETAHWIACGFYLQNLYLGMERIFEKIAKNIDGYTPTGQSSHKELLAQMNLSIEAVRPPVISEESYQYLDELRRFRHWITHNYGFNLDPTFIQKLVDKTDASKLVIYQDMEQFLSFITENYISVENRIETEDTSIH